MTYHRTAVDDTREVIYVGKADRNDFGNRIYTHMRKRHINWDHEVDRSGCIFPQADIIAAVDPDSPTADLIRRGRFSMQFIEIVPLADVDLFEIYAIRVANPCCNKQFRGRMARERQDRGRQ